MQFLLRNVEKIRTLYTSAILKPYLFILPSVMILVAVVLIPIVFLAMLSFGHLSISAGSLNIRFQGLSNYVRVFKDSMFWLSIKHTLLFASVSVGVSYVIGLTISIILNELRGKPGLIQTLIMVPWMIPWVVSGLTWKWMLNPEYGAVNDLLLRMGLIQNKINWFSPKLAMGTIIFVDIWTFLPFVIIVLYAGLRQIPDELLEASKVDGASYWQRLRYIILPLLKPFTFVVLLIRTIFALRAYDKIFVLTNGGPGYATEVFATRIVKTGIGTFDFSYAAVLSFVVLFLTLVISIIYIKAFA